MKEANAGLSVCEIGASIGKLWRELAEDEKARYNEDFTSDKVRLECCRGMLSLCSPVFVRVLDSLRRRAAEVPEVDRSASLRPHQAALAQEEGPAGENCKTKLFFPSFDYITN